MTALPLEKSPAPSALSYFAVLASGFASLVLLALVLDQLGSDKARMSLLLTGFPFLACLAGAALTLTNTASGWYAADRGVPPLLGAFSSLAAVLGSIGFATLPGAYFFLGIDAVPFTTGILLGLLMHAVLIAPFARKDGAYTIAAYIGRRFDSRGLRLASGILMMLPCLLLLTAEFKVAGVLLAQNLNVPLAAAVVALGLTSIAAVVAGGMRTSRWTGAAGGIVALFALVSIAVLASVLVTMLPLPPVSYGIVSRDLARLEAVSGVDTHRAATMVLTLPGAAPAALVKPFVQPFVANDPLSFSLLILTIALGIAAMPVLFAHAGTAPSVSAQRRSSVWLVCLMGVVTLTLPAIAFFARLAVLKTWPTGAPVEPPEWLDLASRMHLADFDRDAASIPLSNVHFARDGIGLLLPIALGLPRPLVDMLVAGIAAAALAAITGHGQALASLWSEDSVFPWARPGEMEFTRVQASRLLSVAGIGLAGYLSISVAADPLTLFAWAMALAGSSVFALLVMSVWWKRISDWGASVALAIGSAAALTQILMSLYGKLPMVFGVSGALASIIAVPLSAGMALLVSLVTPLPQQRMLDLVHDIRVPGGETLQDREARLAKLPKRSEE